MKTRVLLAEDHVLFAEALKQMLDMRYEVVGIVGDGKALLTSARQHRPDVIVTDITMPWMNGLDCARLLCKDSHAPKIVFLTMHSDCELASACFSCGGSAFVVKDSSYDKLVVAIESVMANHTYISPNIAAGLMDRLNTPPADAEGERLTTRQREILQLLAEGKTMKEIAIVTDLSTRTVEWHKYRMMKMLNVSRNAQLVQHVVRLKLVV